VSGRSCRPLGDGDDGSAGVTAIRGADGVEGGDSERERDVVPLIALITDARGDEDGAWVGRASLNGEGDPNSDDDGVPLRVRGDGDGLFFFIANGLLPPSPSAMSARGRRGGESRTFSSLLVVGRVVLGLITNSCCSLRPSSESESESESSDAFASPTSISRPFGNERGSCAFGRV
jgi:hypothetical protein